MRSRPIRHPKKPSRAARHNARETPGTVRIVVADSQAIDRGGLVGMLEEERDFEVVGEAATVKEAIEQCRALEPSVLLLSLGINGQEPEAALPAIRAELPNLRICVLSERGSENCLVLNPPSRRLTPAETNLACRIGLDCLQLAVNQGALATVRRSADPEELFRAIRAAAEGRASYDPTTTSGLISIGRPGDATNGTPIFSPREREVAALIAEGLSNKEISTALKIGEPTVKKHIGSILEKLGLADRLQAGLFLARNPLALKR